MPKQLTTTLLGFAVAISNVPTNLEEAIAACGGGEVGSQKLVDKFVGYSNAHSSYTDARQAIVEAVEKVTGIAQKQETETEQGEKDSVYVTRALAESGKTPADVLAALEIEVDNGDGTKSTKTGVPAIEVEFNAGTSGRRSTGNKGPAKTYVDSATKTIEAYKDQPETLKAVVVGMEKLNPGVVVEKDDNGLPTIDGLAKMLKANSDRKRAELEAENAALGIKVA